MSRVIGIGVFSKELRGSSGGVGKCVDAKIPEFDKDDLSST